MAERRIINGYIVERRDDGSIVTIGPASGPQAMQIAPGNPYAEPKAAAEVKNTQVNANVNSATSEDQIRKARADARRAEIEAREAETSTQRDSSNKTKDYTLRLRGDFDSLPAVKEYRTAISQLVQGLNTKDDAAGDSALIYAYAKVMDPASVVRESEMTMAGAADTVIESAAARIKKQFGIEGGGQLSPTVRDGLRREMVNKVKQYNTIYNHQRQRFAADAQALGVDPQLVIGEHDGAAFMPQLSAYDDARKGSQGTPGLASANATEKSIPIPAQMQAEHADYLRQNWGRVDPEGYAQFRSGLDQKYGFGPRPDAYRDFAASLNESARNGGSPNVPIGPVNAEMAGRDKLNASLFNNEIGAAVMGAGSLGGGMDEIAGGIRSVLNGTDYATERDLTNAMRGAAADAYPLSTITGQLLGAGLTGYAGGSLIPGAAINTLGKAATVGAGYGGVSGALENNSDRAMGGLFGSTLGAVGGTIGQKLIAPIAERATRGFSRTVPQATPGQATLGDMTGDIDNVRANLTLGRDLNMPYSLADADPRLRALAGMVSRKSVNANALAQATFEPRARGQADRAVDAIDRYLAPITDIDQRAKDLRKAGGEAARPYYDMAGQAGVPFDPEIEALVGTPAGQDAMKRAVEIARNEGRDPTELGFIIREDGNVGMAPMAGRYGLATAPNERNELSRGTVRAFNGQEIPKVGPVDMVGWLRTQGGLRDSGGELAHMGLTNAARKGDSVGMETRFGPLVNNESGLDFDSAALRAWEAGYFPELNDRPDVNTFLNALRDTQEGRNRRFLPEDMGQMGRFEAARDARMDLGRQQQEAGQVWVDKSVPAGPDVPFPPASAYGQQEAKIPTFETLDLVKRGLDARLNEARDPFGNLDLTGNPQLQAIEGMRQRLVGSMDRLNPDYRTARGEYAKYAKRAETLGQGEALARNALPQRQFDAALGKISAYDNNFRQPGDMLMPEAQRGYATAMADQVGKARLSANPYESVYGSTNQQQRVGQMFPQGAGRFGQVYDMEREMAKTAHETLGGSPTAQRLQADAQLGDAIGTGIELGADVLSGGGFSGAKGLLSQNARQWMADALRMGVGKRAQAKADEIAPVLYSTNPEEALKALDAFALRRAAINDRRNVAARYGGLFGAALLPSLAVPGS